VADGFEQLRRPPSSLGVECRDRTFQAMGRRFERLGLSFDNRRTRIVEQLGQVLHEHPRQTLQKWTIAAHARQRRVIVESLFAGGFFRPVAAFRNSWLRFCRHFIFADHAAFPQCRLGLYGPPRRRVPPASSKKC
jgi:hypothetical protein